MLLYLAGEIGADLIITGTAAAALLERAFSWVPFPAIWQAT